MIIYKEFSSLLQDLGFSGKTLYSVSNHISRHYHRVDIPKSNGEVRRLHVPDALLLAIQKAINEKLLPLQPISPYAMAYRRGVGTKANASLHVGKPVILKLDIRHFFDRLIFPLVKEKAFPPTRYSEQNRVLLTFLCTYKDALPQGAPTSPAISNIIMRDFDDYIGKWCKSHKIVYTRYCDDMTFSGDFDPAPVIQLVKNELEKMGLYLNTKKTTVIKNGRRKSVTGIVVNEKLSVPADYKKQIRKDMYYIQKYGVESHVQRSGFNGESGRYIVALVGKVNYVLSIEPDNLQFKKYKAWLCNKL